MLEQCLSEEANEANLEIYLPTVRQIITNLLQGLRGKQSVFRSFDSDRRHRGSDSQGSDPDARAMSRSARAGSVSSSRASQTSRFPSANETTTPSDSQKRRSSRKKEPMPTAQLPAPPTHTEDVYFPGGFSSPRQISERLEDDRGSSSRRDTSRSMGTPHSSRPSKDYQHLQRVRSTPNTPFNNEDPNDTTVTSLPHVNASEKSASPVPSNVVRYSLSDNPVPSVVVDGATPSNSSENLAITSYDRRSSAASSSANTVSTPPETPQIEQDQPPFIESSLAALKKSDALERRASKRFSTYNISKMTGTGLREKSGMNKHANRRSMAADSANLTPGDLSVLTEEETPKANDGRRSRGKDGVGRMRTPEPIEEEEVPPVPALPMASNHSTLAPPSLVSWDTAESVSRRRLSTITESKDTDRDSSTMTVFLQLGREVKKVTIEKDLSFSSLRVLFVDKFSYNPGQGNFPDIYIRDPSSGVMYELEDVDEVKDKCLLSLNIDRKYHIFLSK